MAGPTSTVFETKYVGLKSRAQFNAVVAAALKEGQKKEKKREKAWPTCRLVAGNVALVDNGGGGGGCSIAPKAVFAAAAAAAFCTSKAKAAAAALLFANENANM